MERDEELFRRLEGVMADVKFTKSLQWQNVNWSILLFGGLIALSLHDGVIPIGGNLKVVKIAATGLVLLAAVFFGVYQWDHTRALRRFRLQMKAIEKMLPNQLPPRIDKTAEWLKPCEWSRVESSWERLYCFPFLLAIVVSAAITTFIIWTR